MSIVIKYPFAKGYSGAIIYLAKLFKEVVLCKR